MIPISKGKVGAEYVSGFVLLLKHKTFYFLKNVGGEERLSEFSKNLVNPLIPGGQSHPTWIISLLSISPWWVAALKNLISRHKESGQGSHSS